MVEKGMVERVNHHGMEFYSTMAVIVGVIGSPKEIVGRKN